MGIRLAESMVVPVPVSDRSPIPSKRSGTPDVRSVGPPPADLFFRHEQDWLEFFALLLAPGGVFYAALSFAVAFDSFNRQHQQPNP